MSRALPVLALCATLCTPARGAAQETDFADSTGLTWGIATFELAAIATVAGAAILGSQRAPEAQPFLIYGLAISAALGIAASVAAQVLDAPVEVPMVFHHGFTGGVLLGGLASSLLATTLRDDTPAWVGLGALAVGAAGAATYAALRSDRLAHAPELLEEAHALSWAPLASAGVTAIVVALAGATEAAPILGALVGIVVYGITIGFVEDAIASHPAPMTAPLVHAAGRF